VKAWIFLCTGKVSSNPGAACRSATTREPACDAGIERGECTVRGTIVRFWRQPGAADLLRAQIVIKLSLCK